MSAKICVFAICVETIIYLLLYNLHGCTFKFLLLQFKKLRFKSFNTDVLYSLEAPFCSIDSTATKHNLEYEQLKTAKCWVS